MDGQRLRIRYAAERFKVTGLLLVGSSEALIKCRHMDYDRLVVQVEELYRGAAFCNDQMYRLTRKVIDRI